MKNMAIVTKEQAIDKAVGKLMLSLDQDTSRIDRRSRGFLGIA